jgi:methanesulfonate monooxygenase small subunit
MSATRAGAEELVYRAALRLDALDFDGFLALCEPNFRYTAGTYSPEIRRPMLWLDQDRAALKVLFDTLPRHNSDHAPLSRHVTVYTVDAGSDGLLAVVSALQVFRTTLDGGATELFAVGKLHDTARVSADGARLVRRHLELQTRMLGIGSHIPL